MLHRRMWKGKMGWGIRGLKSMEKFKNVENLQLILKNFDGWVKKNLWMVKNQDLPQSIFWQMSKKRLTVLFGRIYNGKDWHGTAW